jgi:hypothetical protein
VGLPDILAITAGASLIVGGFLGLIVGVAPGRAMRDVVDDGQRGAFLGGWFGALVTLLLYGATKAS